MNTKTFPLTLAQINERTTTRPTPFYIYDESAIRANARRIQAAFAGIPGYREYFAVKALPNPFILKILAEEGFGADCSSLAELKLCEKVGLRGDRVFMTSNDTPDVEFQAARDLGAIINLDDLSHLEAVQTATGSLPETICFRYNPGPLKGGNAIIGKPEEAKYGLTRDQIFEAFARAKAGGVKRFGLHTMVASNELNVDYHIDTARMLFELAAEVKRRLGISLSFLNGGGGLGIPYRPEESPVDLAALTAGIRKAYADILVPADLGGTAYVTEWGRCITGPYGWLVTRAVRRKEIYRTYIGVDASMADLMRPGMYGAYHHISVLGKETTPPAPHPVDVVGSLCENCDKFAVQRMLPPIELGDVLVIHDAGAHGHAMGFNYNGKLRCAEWLLRPDGSLYPIRRAETLDDLFATLDNDALEAFR